MNAKSKSLALTTTVFSLGLGMLICAMLMTANRFISHDTLAKQHHQQMMISHHVHNR